MGTLVCPSCCGGAFPSKTALKKHLVTLSENLYCSECCKKFDTLRGLIEHLDTACAVRKTNGHRVVIDASESAESSECPVCPETNSRKLQPLSTADELYSEEDMDLATYSPYCAAQSENVLGSLMVDAATIDATNLLNNDHATNIFCTSCDVNITSVVDHIRTFHPNETVHYDDEIEENEDGTSCRADKRTHITDHLYVTTEQSQPLPKDNFHSTATMREGIMLTVQSCDMDYKTIASDIMCFEGIAEENSSVDGGIQSQEHPKTILTEPLVDHVDKAEQQSLPPQELSQKLMISKVPTQRQSLETVETLTPMLLSALTLPQKRKSLAKRQIFSQRLLRDSNAITIEGPLDSPEKRSPSTKMLSQMKEMLPTLKSSICKVNIITVPTIRKMVHVGAFWAGKSGESCQTETAARCEGMERTLAHSLEKKDNFSTLHKLAGTLPNTEGSTTTHVQTEIGDIQELNSGTKNTYIPRVFVTKLVVSPDFPEGEVLVTRYFCSKCPRDFSDERTFKLHKCPVPVHLQPVCPVCNLKCPTTRSFTGHLRKHDPTYKVADKPKYQPRKFEQTLVVDPEGETMSSKYVCIRCRREFEEEQKFKMHKCTLPTQLHRTCPVCGLTFGTSRNYTIHLRLHDPEYREQKTQSKKVFRGRLFECKVCKIKLTTLLGLSLHMKMHRPMKEKKAEKLRKKAAKNGGVAEGPEDLESNEYFTCAECNERLHIGRREMHEKMHQGNLLFCCPHKQCNKYFPSQEQLDIHLRVLHVSHEADSVFSCYVCKGKFAAKEIFLEHIKKHINSKKPHQCSFCGRGFSKPSERVTHEWIHTGEQPHVCTTCGMRFRKAFCLVSHERIHSGCKPYACEICGKKSRTSSMHSQHMRSHSDLKLYCCKLCPKRYKTLVQLSAHRNVHSKPYSCNECSRCFSDMYRLRKHMEGHRKKETRLKHNCPVCGASYGRAYALRDHVLTHSGNLPTPRPAAKVLPIAEFDDTE